MSFSFFILVPTLPFYLRDTFGIGQSMIGFVLSCYTIAVLSIRPFSGFLADTFPRKRVYIIAYCLLFCLYIFQEFSRGAAGRNVSGPGHPKGAEVAFPEGAGADSKGSAGTGARRFLSQSF